MANSGSLGTPLVDTNEGARAWWRRSAGKILVVTTALGVIAAAGFFILAPFDAGSQLHAEKTMLPEPKSVSEALKSHPRVELVNIKKVNELFKRLPAYETSLEDMVYQHIKPQAKRLYHNFLQSHGTTAPHFKTGERLKRRHKLDDKNEFQYRLGVFESMLHDIIRLNNFEAHHNSRPDRAVFAVTKFSDWTWAEFQTLLKGPATKLNTTISSKHSQGKVSSRVSPPCTKNWAAENPSVFVPRDQGSCGSCYAHAATETIRAQAFINTGTDPGELSVQYIIDCKGNGCNGGDAGNVMNWVQSQGGIPTKMDYGPYSARKESCKSNVANSITTTGAHRFYDEEDTANQLCYHGPLSMGVHVNSAFQSYHSGVLSHDACPPSPPNHDTQVVAVLEDKGAFMIRNSWGSEWGINPSTFEPASGGDGGFILVEYGHNTCDLTDCNSFAKDVSCLGDCGDHPAPAPSPPYDGGGDALCSNTCHYPSDGECDDGGPGSSYSLCAYGSDCEDCGPRSQNSNCNDSCRWANDGECDEPMYCPAGTDCTDCNR